MRRAAIPALALLILTNLLLRPAAPDVVRRTLAPGVEYMQETVPPPAGPLVWNVLRMDLKAPGVRVQAALGRDVVLTDEPAKGRESVGATAERHGALAAVNADFFPFTGDPLGITIRDGELLSESMAHRAALGITADGHVLFDTLLPVGTLFAADGALAALDGINRLPAKNEIVVLTPAFGAATRAPAGSVAVPLANVNLPVKAGQEQAGAAGESMPGDPASAIPAGGAVLVGMGIGAEWLRAHVKAGDTARFRFDFASRPLPPGPPRGDLASRAGALRGTLGRSAWTDVAQAVGGGPWLVRDGRIAVDGAEEGFSAKSFVEARHPRTAAGVTADGALLLVTVDGRQAHSRGVSLRDLAACMLRLGATQAINLDGGGSTAMWVRGLYVNGPSDGEPRAVASALLVFGETPSASLPTETTADPVTLRAGETVTMKTPEGADALWGTADGRGFVSQRGVFRSTRAGSGTITVLAGERRVRLPFLVQAGPAARLKAALSAVPNNPPDRNMLTVTLTDAYGNPAAGQTVRIQAVGGVAERAEAETDADGRVTLEIVWDVEKGRRVVVTCGSRKAEAAVR